MTAKVRSKREFEMRRLHNLLLLYEDARDMQERLHSADSVAHALRVYLSENHNLVRRSR